LEQDLKFISGVARVRRPPKLPVVLAPEQIRRVLANLNAQYRYL